MKKVYFLLLTVLFAAFTNAQTTLISPTGDGGFENGATFAANGWTAVNGATNQWFVGAVSVPSAGTNSAYVSNDPAGATYNYLNTASSTVHFYRDITFPAGETNILLTFRWKGQGEGNYDYVTVYSVPTSVTPVFNSPAGAFQSWLNIPTAYPGAVIHSTPPNLNLQAAYQTQTICLPAAYAGTTRRLVFMWSNDGSVGTQPPGSVDEISLVSSTPSVPAAQPTGLGLTAFSPSQINGSFTATTADGYLVVRYPTGATPVNPTTGTTYTTGNSLGTGTVVQSAAGITFNATGLAPSTTYDFYVYAYNNSVCAGAQYRTVSPLFGTQTTPACTGPTGIIPVGPTGTYPSLTAGLAAIATGISGPVIFELQATYLSVVETFPITFPNNGCAGPVNTITVRPETGAVGLTITSANATATIDFNGANYVTIDGRPGGLGVTSQLTVTNTATGTAVAIRYINDAINNTVRYCSITGSTSTSFGVVLFSTGIITGNDNNTISNNDIGPAGANLPLNGIYSLGTSAVIDNSANTVTGNNIFDYFNASSATSGMNINSNNSAWTITNNKLYQTATRLYTISGTHNGINITSGSGYTITGNTIGFANSAGTGTTNIVGNTIALAGFPGSYAVAGTANATRYIAISCAFTAGGAVSSIQNNTLAGFALYTSSGATTTNGIWCGINLTSGNADIGTTTGNTIGATTGNGSIYAACSSAGGAIVGIYASSTNTVNIRNNTIGAIDAMGNLATGNGGITGINSAGTAGNFDISGNTIGNATDPNLRTGNLTTAGLLSNTGTTFGISTGSGMIRGILNSATGIITIGTPAMPNIIRNASNNSSSSSTANGFRSIENSGGGTGGFIISSNAISNFTSQSTNTTLASGTMAGIGIYNSTTTSGLAGSSIILNTITGLSLTNATANGTNVAGISIANYAVSILRNRICDIRNASTSAATLTPGTASGIFLRSATAGIPMNIANNMISLGNAQTTNTRFVGIWVQCGSTPNPIANVYYNTINIEGAVAAGAQPSFGVLRGSFVVTMAVGNAVPVDIRNNILNNTRSGGTGGHFAIANLYGTTTVTGGTLASGWGVNASNYNVLNAANAARLGNWTTDQTFAGWKAASASDANSLTAIPVTFVSTCDLHLNMGVTPTQLESGGTPIASITTDIDNQTRPGPAGSTNGGALAPDLGADEFDGVVLDLSPPAISYTLLPNTLCAGNVNLSAAITDISGVNTTAGTKPRVYYKKTTNSNTFNDNTNATDGWKFAEASNAASPFTFTLNMALINGGVAGGDVIQYFVVAQDLVTTPNVGINSGTFAVPPTSVALTAAAFPITGTINSYTIGTGGLSGTVTIGAAGTYPTITGAGGLFAAINASGLTGNVTANILDASVTETAATALNQMSYGCGGPFTLTIKPNTGVTSTLTGSFAGYLLRILSSNVVIDGSNNGTTSRDLTIENTSATSPSVVLIGSIGTTSITNVTLKNSIVINGAQTNSAVVVSDGTAPGTAGYFTNITIQNNSIQRAYIANYNIAVPLAGNGAGLNINSNDINTAGANSVRLVPIYIQGIDGATVSNNNLGNVANTADANITGIWLATATVNTTLSGNNISGMSGTTSAPRGIAVSSGVAAANINLTGNTISGLTSSSTGTTTGIYVFSTTSGVTVQKNNISNIKNTNATGFGSNGIQLASTLTAAAIDVHNNYVSDVAGNGFAGTSIGNNGYGIIITAGGGYNLYYNTVVMNTNQSNVAGLAAALNVTSGVITANSLNIRNNIFANTQTTGTQRYSVISGASSSVYSDINYNNYYFTGPNLGNIGGTTRANLAAWQAGTTKDAQSKSVQPIFISATDFHLSNAAGANWCLNGTGQTIATYTTDYDGDTRGTPPDIGADEFVATGSGIATPASQTVCTATPITTIVLSGATSYTWVRDNTVAATGIAASGTGDISGTLTNTTASPVTVTFTITAFEANGCVAPATFTATVTVNPNNTITLTSAPGTDAQTVCVNTAITNITYSTTGATGATFSGLPAGVTGSWAANVVTISGSPTTTVGSPFSYTVTLTGGCGSVTANGTITVTPDNTITLTSAPGTDAQTVCVNTAITNITYSTTGATGATFSGLPAGVTGSWAANVVTISGTPTTAVGSPFSYTVTLTGGCGSVTANGTITVTPDNTITLTSAPGTDAQSVCLNTPITNITYSTTGATGATFSGLPAGVTGSWAANVVTISGTPTTTVGSPFSYTVTLTGGCGSVTANGTITVRTLPVINSTQIEPTTCASSDGSIDITVTGAAGPYTYAWTGPGVIPGNEDQINLTVGNYSVTVTAANGCTATASFALAGPGGCSICPTIPTLATTPSGGACAGSNVTFTASGLTDMGSTYGIIFKYSAAALPNPYVGGTNIATVANGALTSGGTVATANSASIPVGSYFVYAILTPTPVDPACRPSATVNLTIGAVPDVDQPADQVVCNNSPTAPVNFTGSVPGTVFNWTNSDPSIGLAASGTGDIASFTATNATTAPVVATVTVIPSYTTAGGGAPTSITMPAQSGTFSGNVRGYWFTAPVNFNITSLFIPTDASSGNQSIAVLRFNGNTPPPVFSTTTNAFSTLFLTQNDATVGNIAVNIPILAGEVIGMLGSRAGLNSYGNGSTGITIAGNPVSTTRMGMQFPLATTTPQDIWQEPISTNISRVLFEYTVGAGVTCTGSPKTFTITVNPTPNAVATPASQTICSGSAITTIALTSAVSGTTYSWTRDNTVTATGIAASGTGNISGSLTNTTNSPVTVTFTIIPTANGCAGAAITATVLVNPTPNAVATPSSQTICSGSAITPIILSSASGSLTVGLVSSTWADEISLQLVDASSNAVVSAGPFGLGVNYTSPAVPATNGPYTFNIEALGSVQDNYADWTIYCNGNPIANGCIRGNVGPACGTATGTYSLPGINCLGGVAGTVYNWTRNNTATVTGIPASGSGNISGTLVNTTNAPVTVTFTITPTANGCPGTPITATVLVNPTPNVVATPASQTVCSALPITTIVMSGNVSGTTYAWVRDNTATVTGMAASGSGNISGSLINTTASPITVTFTITPTANGCTGVPITATVTVTPQPAATISYPGSPYCSTVLSAPVTRTGTAGGTYSAAPAGLTINPVTGTVTPSTSTPGTYTVTYTIAPSGGCLAYTTTTTITITAAPNMIIFYAGSPYCSNAGTATVSQFGTAGGTYSAAPAGLTINAATGAVTLGTSTPGTYTVTYSVTAPGCGVTNTTTTITITAAPAATISYAGSPYCSNAGTANVTRTGTAGGTYSSTPGLTINATTGAVTLGTSTPGTYTVTYTIAASGGCAVFTTTTTITITALPAATISYAGSPYCSNAGTANVTRTGTAGGTYTAAPAGLTINATTGAVTLGTSTPGTYTVTYTIAAGGGCPVVTATTTITITALPAATISYAGSPYCQNAGTATVTRTGNAGGVYSAAPAGLTINAATGDVTLGTSTPGTYTVSYTLAAGGGCPAVVATTTITVSSLSVVATAANASATSLCGPGTVTLSVTGGSLGTGGVWRWYSGTCGGTLVGTGATLANVTVSATTTYFVRAEGTCNTTACVSVTVTVNTQPTISITATLTSLSPFKTSTLTATVSPAAGNTTVWYRNGVLIPGATGLTYIVDFDKLGTYTARTTTAAGCTALSNAVTITAEVTKQLFITPNPNNGQFKVRYYTSANSLGFVRHLVMFNEGGQKVFDQTYPITAPYSSMDIDARRLPKGFYIVMLTDAFGKEVLATGKVVIQ